MKQNESHAKLISDLHEENKELWLQIKNMEDLHKTVSISQSDRQARHSLLKAQARKLKYKKSIPSKLRQLLTQLCLLPHDIFYFASVGLGILPVWWNVGPHFVTIFGFNTSHINICFANFFSAFCTMQLPLQDSGMTKLGLMSILFIIIILLFQWLKFA